MERFSTIGFLFKLIEYREESKKDSDGTVLFIMEFYNEICILSILKISTIGAKKLKITDRINRILIIQNILN